MSEDAETRHTEIEMKGCALLLWPLVFLIVALALVDKL